MKKVHYESTGRDCEVRLFLLLRSTFLSNSKVTCFGLGLRLLVKKLFWVSSKSELNLSMYLITFSQEFCLFVCNAMHQESQFA